MSSCRTRCVRFGAFWADLKMEIQTEQELSQSVALVTWEAMEALEGALVDLGALLLLIHHTVGEMDISLGHLRRAEEVCLSVAQAYGDYYAKVAWTTAFASL